MMTQALNALNISSSPGEESLAKKASARKQAGRQNNGIGHVGLRATNPAASAEFYTGTFLVWRSSAGARLTIHPGPLPS